MFLQKLYHRITVNAGAGKNKEKYNRRLRELEKQQKALNKNKQKLVGRIQDLTAQAKQIAEDANRVREEKLQAEKDQAALQKEELKARQKMTVLNDIMNETDAKERAKKMKKAQKILASAGIDTSNSEGFEQMAASMLDAEQARHTRAHTPHTRSRALSRALTLLLSV